MKREFCKSHQLEEMQTTQTISEKQLQEIVVAIYDQGPVVVKQAYSDLDAAPREFVDAEALIDELRFRPGQKFLFSSYAIYYPEAKGYIYEERITLKPGSCGDHTFRFSQEGWGLIHLQCNFRNHPKIECRIAVNTETRAGNWSDTIPALRSPDLWDWRVVNKKAGKLIRLLKKLGKLAGTT
jgi:hypothetical protein